MSRDAPAIGVVAVILIDQTDATDGQRGIAGTVADLDVRLAGHCRREYGR